jgi:ribosomal protein S8
MSHNVSDFVIRLRNAIRANHSYVKIGNTKLNRSISNILRSEGFIDSISYTTSNNVIALENGANPSRSKRETVNRLNDISFNTADGAGLYASPSKEYADRNTQSQLSKHSDFIVLYLKYVGKRNTITGMNIISKPSARIYSSAKQFPKVLGGLGALIVTTSKGVMTDKKARSLNVGGEILFSIW